MEFYELDAAFGYQKAHLQHHVGESRLKVADTGYETPCWLWTSPTIGDGYGRITWEGIFQQASRVAFVLSDQGIPDDMDLNHLCQVKLCCRPDHLEPVTARETGKRNAAHHGKKLCPHGEHTPRYRSRTCIRCGKNRNRRMKREG